MLSVVSLTNAIVAADRFLSTCRKLVPDCGLTRGQLSSTPQPELQREPINFDETDALPPSDGVDLHAGALGIVLTRYSLYFL